MIDIAMFLLDRYAEDEEAARMGEKRSVEMIRFDVPGFGARPGDEDVTAYLERFTPGRVLEEIAARREIVRGLNYVMRYEAKDERGMLAAPHYFRLLALPYSGHPDWREEWRP